MREVIRQRQIGNHAVMAAGRAKGLRVIRRDQPVADAVLDIGAVAVAGSRLRQCAPDSAIRRKRSHDLALRQIAQAQPAALAARVLEIERLPAVLAFEELHAAPMRVGLGRSSITPTRIVSFITAAAFGNLASPYRRARGAVGKNQPVFAPPSRRTSTAARCASLAAGIPQ